MSFNTINAIADANKVQAMNNPVRIVLQNEKNFRAVILGVMNNGEKLHVIRLPSMRREVLSFGTNFGDINSVAPLEFRNVARNLERSGLRFNNNDSTASLGRLGAAAKEIKSAVPRVNLTSDKMMKNFAKGKNHKQYSEFVTSQIQYFNEKERMGEVLDEKIRKFEARQKQRQMQTQAVPRVFIPQSFIEAGLRGRENPGLQAGDESYPLK